MNFYGGKKTNGLSSVLTLFVKRRQKKHKNRRAIRLTYNAKLSRNISSLTNFKQVILTVCLNPRQQAAGARYGCKYNSLRKLCDNTLKTNKKQKANRSLLVKNVGPSCIYVNMRDSKTIRWHVLLKKKKNRWARAGTICSLPWSYTACKEFFWNAFYHFHCLQFKNASPMIASENSRVHLVSLLMINKPTNWWSNMCCLLISASCVLVTF